ncbi:uncharacterized protein B0J16DRAFT_186465 [Fusarium flagelliforme]|uniref:uncharacterized protein n=1 Tax=Fusarium flagelliforme TaxID=2675880 RepID=UPI001E8DE507|nr:uncharacterized protein B0J16DRAFT_186465 [Fusarium flagelliforme]KAH7174997.1 hypothetical protein B0J16DRAFT_186465 [Fusarium flagelliforme]
MALNTTTALLLPDITGHFVASIKSANPTATTYILDCDWSKYPWQSKGPAQGPDDCYVESSTVILGPWADKTPAPGKPTTGTYKDSYVHVGNEDEHDAGFSFAAECQMSGTWAEKCTTTLIGGYNDGTPNPGTATGTFTRQTGTEPVADFFYWWEYGTFTYVDVTVTAGLEYLTVTGAAAVAETGVVTTKDVKDTSTVGEATSNVNVDAVSTDEPASAVTTSNNAGNRRRFSLWGVIGLVAAVSLL